MTDMLRIRGGLVLDPVEGAPVRADIVFQGGRIVAVTARLAGGAAPELDATDRLLIPGLVNGHTHSHGSIAKGMIGVFYI